jgi:hypothetical protein
MMSKVYVRFRDEKVSIVMDGNILKANQVPFPSVTFTGPIQQDKSWTWMFWLNWGSYSQFDYRFNNFK